ncbi:MAG: hypothetical protein WBK55_06670 [Alphaproteobacteria bacterium]
MTYKRHNEIESLKIDLSREQAFKDAFGKSGQSTAPAQSLMPDEKPQPNERLDVTDFKGNQQSFHVPEMHPEPTLDVGKPTDRPEEPTKIEQKNESVKADYLEANQQICDQMLDAIDNVPDGGKELGAAIRSAMPQAGGGNSMLQLAAVGADAAIGGAAGNVYAAINAIYADNKSKNGIVGAEAGKILETAFHNLHATNQAQAEAYKKNPALTKPPLDLSSLKTPQQMVDFLIRDVSQDPVMKKILNNEQNIAKRWENIENYDDHYTDTPTAEKIAFEIDRGRVDIAQEMLKGQQINMELAKAGDSIGAMEGKPTTIPAVEIGARMRMEDIKGVKPKENDISDMSATAKEILAAFKIPDPKMPAFKQDLVLG